MQLSKLLQIKKAQVHYAKSLESRVIVALVQNMLQGLDQGSL